MGVTPPSTWPWLDHPVSGLPPATERPVQTRFRSAFAYRLKLAANGNSLTHYTKGTPSPHPHHKCCHSRVLEAPTACRHPVSGLFHSPLGVLFTFPSRYCFTIGRQLVFSFGQWSARIPTRFHVSRGTQELAWREIKFRLRGFHPLCRTVPGPSAIRLLCNSTTAL